MDANMVAETLNETLHSFSLNDLGRVILLLSVSVLLFFLGFSCSIREECGDEKGDKIVLVWTIIGICMLLSSIFLMSIGADRERVNVTNQIQEAEESGITFVYNNKTVDAKRFFKAIQSSDSLLQDRKHDLTFVSQSDNNIAIYFSNDDKKDIASCFVKEEVQKSDCDQKKDSQVTTQNVQAKLIAFRIDEDGYVATFLYDNVEYQVKTKDSFLSQQIGKEISVNFITTIQNGQTVKILSLQ